MPRPFSLWCFWSCKIWERDIKQNFIPNISNLHTIKLCWINCQYESIFFHKHRLASKHMWYHDRWILRRFELILFLYFTFMIPNYMLIITAFYLPYLSFSFLSLFSSLLTSEPDYLLFAPSAIAISALLISFSVLHMPCTSWLKTIPDICLPNNTSSIYPNNSKESRFLDIDRCICCFKKIPFLQSRSKNRSPTSVTEMFETSSDSPSSA